MMPKNCLVEVISMNRRYPSLLVSIALLFLTACSESPKTESTGSDTAGPSGPVTGKDAFWQMYKLAYSSWAKDLMPVKLESKEVAGVKNEAGKAGMWKATFGSTSKHEVVEITYSVVAQPPDITKGINFGHKVPWAGPTGDAMTFGTADLSVDSDAAYKTASAQADAWIKKHPDTQPSFALGKSNRFSTPVWWVLWGDSKTGYGVFINAKTGAVAKPGK